jgi:hypothetical protein
MGSIPIGPLSLDSQTFDYWGSFDAAIIAQLAPLCENDCYQPRIYRAPAVSAESFAANSYATYGMKITPGSLIYGFYLPPSSPTVSTPGQFNVQIRDESLKMDWFDQPIPSYFLANAQLTYLQATGLNVVGAFPSLLCAPYPVVGTGLFAVQIWETSGSAQRIELVFGVLEAIGAACL